MGNDSARLQGHAIYLEMYYELLKALKQSQLFVSEWNESISEDQQRQYN